MRTDSLAKVANALEQASDATEEVREIDISVTTIRQTDTLAGGALERPHLPATQGVSAGHSGLSPPAFPVERDHAHRWTFAIQLQHQTGH